MAATQIASGCAEIAIAGGVESITGLGRGTPAEFDENPRLLEEKPDIYMAMGHIAELCRGGRDRRPIDVRVGVRDELRQRTILHQSVRAQSLDRVLRLGMMAASSKLSASA